MLECLYSTGTPHEEAPLRYCQLYNLALLLTHEIFSDLDSANSVAVLCMF